jgi:hypothetical protein
LPNSALIRPVLGLSVLVMPSLDSSLRGPLRRDTGAGADQSYDSWWWSSVILLGLVTPTNTDGWLDGICSQMGHHRRHLPHSRHLPHFRIHARKETDSERTSSTCLSSSTFSSAGCRRLLTYTCQWLLNRRQREQFETPQNTAPFYRTQVGYNMPDFRPPPPGQSPPHYRFSTAKLTETAYNPDTDYVPAYSPPEGGSKINPSQSYAEVPPAGPPPSHSRAESSAKSPTVTPPSPEASASSDRR